jgi:peroxiredoxin
MAVSSTMLPLGSSAPSFQLRDTVSGELKSLAQLKSEIATVIMFICNHCPYVKHIQHELVRLTQDYQSKKVAFIAISANDAQSYPEDAPDKMRSVAKQFGYSFPYLYDETQEVAKAYHAACTPDFFIYDKHLHCVYRGQLDDSRPGNNIPVTGHDIRAALDNLIADKPIAIEQKSSIGCSIKWKQ